MRIVLYFSFLSCLFCGCNYKTDTFQSIDYSCFISPARIYSVKISNDRHVIIYKYNRYLNSKYYHDFTLNKAVLDSLNKLTELIMNSNFDSTYSLSCDRCLRYCLIIKANKRTFKVFYHGDLFTDKNLILLDKFSKNINLLVENRQELEDSIYRFSSWSKYLLPPPPSCDSLYEETLKEYLPNFH